MVTRVTKMGAIKVIKFNVKFNVGEIVDKGMQLHIDKGQKTENCRRGNKVRKPRRCFLFCPLLGWWQSAGWYGVTFSNFFNHRFWHQLWASAHNLTAVLLILFLNFAFDYDWFFSSKLDNYILPLYFCKSKWPLHCNALEWRQWEMLKSSSTKWGAKLTSCFSCALVLIGEMQIYNPRCNGLCKPNKVLCANLHLLTPPPVNRLVIGNAPQLLKHAHDCHLLRLGVGHWTNSWRERRPSLSIHLHKCLECFIRWMVTWHEDRNQISLKLKLKIRICRGWKGERCRIS